MKKKSGILILICFGCSFSLIAQIKLTPDSVKFKTPNEKLYSLPKRPIIAASTAFGINMGVWGFDRLILNTDYSRIDLKTISSNFKTGFVWDEDMFTTNLFAHPYHGSLYFNAARSNGMNFWQSAPFVAGGSLMWEFGMENEPASINDFFATSFGGICLGEITYRISDLFIDERAIGFERFGREFLTTLISPINGFNRILSGRASHYSTKRNNSVSKLPVVGYISIGHRFIYDNPQKHDDIINTASYNLGLYYGNPFDKDNVKPYDAFVLKMSGNFIGNQPIIHRFNALGVLYSQELSKEESKNRFILGLYQHFNFYNLKAEVDHELIYPYKISEAASVGPGLLYRREISSRLRLFGTAHLSAILLGGSQTDHFRTEKRDYNMGSGFSSKINLDLEFKKKVRLYFESEDYRLYSWVGSKIPNSTEFESNSQGDIGNASLTVSRIGFQYSFSKHFLISTETSFNYRRSYYKYYEPKIIEHYVAENIISLGYIL